MSDYLDFIPIPPAIKTGNTVVDTGNPVDRVSITGTAVDFGVVISNSSSSGDARLTFNNPDRSYSIGLDGVASVNDEFKIVVGADITSGQLILSSDSLGRITFGGNTTHQGGVVFKAANTTTDLTIIGDEHHIIYCDATSSNIVITLPDGVGLEGREYVIVKVDSSVNTVRIKGPGVPGDSVNSNTNYLLTSQYDSVIVNRFNTNQWVVIASNFATFSGLFDDGTAASPSMTFTSDTNTGIYKSASDQLSIATNGILRLTVSTTAIDAAHPFRSISGSAVAPSHGFHGDPDTGMFSTGANTLNFSTAGVERGSFSSSGTFALTNRIVVPNGTVGIPSYSFSGDVDTGLFLASIDAIGITTGGTLSAFIDGQGIETRSTTSSLWGASNTSSSYDSVTASNSSSTWILTHHNIDNTFRSGIQSLNNGGDVRLYVGASSFNFNEIGQFIAPVGSVATPSITFSGDTNTGLYNTSGKLLVSCDAVAVGSFATTGMQILNGTAANPSYSFTSDTNSGMYSYAADTIGFAVNGASALYFNASTVYLPSSVRSVSATSTGMSMSSTNLVLTVSNSVKVDVSTTECLSYVPIKVNSNVQPQYRFADADTGIFYDSGNPSLGFMLNGSVAVDVNASGLFVTGDINSSGTAYWGDGKEITRFTDTWLRLNPDNDFTSGITCGTSLFRTDGQLHVGASGATLLVNGATFTHQGNDIWTAGKVIAGPLGTVALPAFSFSSDTPTGIYSPGPGQLGITTSGTQRALFTTTGASIPFADGSAAAPSISFHSESNSGFFKSNTENFYASAGGRAVACFFNTVGVNGYGLALGEFAAEMNTAANDTIGTNEAMLRLRRETGGRDFINMKSVGGSLGSSTFIRMSHDDASPGIGYFMKCYSSDGATLRFAIKDTGGLQVNSTLGTDINDLYQIVLDSPDVRLPSTVTNTTSSFPNMYMDPVTGELYRSLMFKQTRYLTANFSVTSNTSTATVTGFSGSAITIVQGGVYNFEAEIFCDESGGGYKVGIYTTGVVDGTHSFTFTNSNTVEATGMVTGSSSGTVIAFVSRNDAGANNTSSIIIKGTFEHVGLSATDTISVVFAQNTSSGSASYMKKFSTIKVERIA